MKKKETTFSKGKFYFIDFSDIDKNSKNLSFITNSIDIFFYGQNIKELIRKNFSQTQTTKTKNSQENLSKNYNGL